ncbi:MAG: sigma 54-interacting transcriptional regulator [Candidatus Adiutrix intracellularis]|nr:sigma 54-interacting transcriptional regulator [Candidatus Adiutrix intracellularis]
MFKSEIFSHAKSFFTRVIKDRIGRFELAYKGTLFNDYPKRGGGTCFSSGVGSN